MDRRPPLSASNSGRLSGRYNGRSAPFTAPRPQTSAHRRRSSPRFTAGSSAGPSTLWEGHGQRTGRGHGWSNGSRACRGDGGGGDTGRASRPPTTPSRPNCRYWTAVSSDRSNQPIGPRNATVPTVHLRAVFGPFRPDVTLLALRYVTVGFWDTTLQVARWATCRTLFSPPDTTNRWRYEDPRHPSRRGWQICRADRPTDPRIPRRQTRPHHRTPRPRPSTIPTRASGSAAPVCRTATRTAPDPIGG